MFAIQNARAMHDFACSVGRNDALAVSENAQFLRRGPKAALADSDAGSWPLHVNYAGGASPGDFVTRSQNGHALGAVSCMSLYLIQRQTIMVKAALLD